MEIDSYTNIIILTLTTLGFIIGFINPEFRLLAWSLSFIILTVLVIFLIFRDYIKKIDDTENQIREIKKDLNIANRLSKLEGKIEVIEKQRK